MSDLRKESIEPEKERFSTVVIAVFFHLLTTKRCVKDIQPKPLRAPVAESCSS